MCLRWGNVMCQSSCSHPAPSTRAASYSSSGMPCNAAQYTIIANGKPREIHGCERGCLRRQDPGYGEEEGQNSVEVVEHPSPRDRGRDRRDHVRNEEQRARERNPAPGTIEEQSGGQAEQKLAPHTAQGPHEIVPEASPEDRVVQEVIVVLESHEAPDPEQVVVVLEAQVGVVRDRVRDEDDQEDQRGKQE